jgi:6-phosphogluconolactonase
MNAGNRSILLCLLAAFFVAAWGLDTRAAEPGKARVYFGTYTNQKSKGIYVAELDLASGKLGPVELAAEIARPPFLAIHPSRPLLYSVGEMLDAQGKKIGAVNAFSVDPKTGKLALLNQQSAEGAGPCHLAVDGSGKNVLVANYRDGTIACLPILGDGKVAKATSKIQHEGSSVNPRRQQGPHAHSINVDPANRFAFVADLGLDKVLIYDFDCKKGTLKPNSPPFAKVDPGGGPRHFAFHPSGRFAYVINELLSTVTAFAYDADKGSLKSLQTISTLPKGFSGDNSTAEVLVHPSGKFLYGSNRGHDSIAMFAIDTKTGKLTHIGNESTQGKRPRNFGIDPTGAFLLAANQDSDTVVVFRVDSKTGVLQPTGQTVSVPTPVCVRMVPVER